MSELRIYWRYVEIKVMTLKKEKISSILMQFCTYAKEDKLA